MVILNQINPKKPINQNKSLNLLNHTYKINRFNHNDYINQNTNLFIFSKNRTILLILITILPTVSTSNICNTPFNNFNYKNQCYFNNNHNLSLRQTQTIPNWIHNNGCSETSKYTYSSTPNIITRKSHNNNDESYLMFKLPDFMDFTGSPKTPLIWKTKTKTITDGGIFMGVCAFDGRSPPSSCDKTNDITKSVYFSGISLTYFGEDCYNLDMYLNNNYWTTPRHCLSKYELYNTGFIFKLQFTGFYGSNFAELFINFDDLDIYYRNNVLVRADTSITPNVELVHVYPCTYMFVQGSEVEVMVHTTYP